ncbi:unnamed protein product, partial [Heterosigma akashiwo]
RQRLPQARAEERPLQGGGPGQDLPAVRAAARGGGGGRAAAGGPGGEGRHGGPPGA